MKKKIAAILVFLLVFSMAGTSFAIEGVEDPIPEVILEVSSPVCGQEVYDGGSEENRPVVYIANGEMARLSEPGFWAEPSSEPESSDYLPFEGTIVGDQVYTAILTIEAKEGSFFNKDSRLRVYDDEAGALVECEPIRRDSDRIVAAVSKKAVHEWNTGKTERTAPTCLSSGEARYVCAADPSHVLTEELNDPGAHSWGDWTVVREASREETGWKEHTCKLCGMVEGEEIPKPLLPYSRVYEPDTSWSMAATVAWQADETAVTVAHGSVRPATAFVWLDSQLKVRDRDGDLISTDLSSYINSTAAGMIPAFYIEDSAAASALKEWIPLNGLQDCFVVASPENKALVESVADLVHVRGMLDYTAVKDPGREELLDMVASVNGAHGKVILLSEKAATGENVRLLQSLGSTVWAKCSADTGSLLTLYTNGVNGVLVNDYIAALQAQERIHDDAPSLLRVPLIIGHRGDPSIFVENTLDSAKGAWEEGADSVENDIQLSADGRLFILHDESVQRFLGIPDLNAQGFPVPAETFTLEELRAHPFIWNDPEYGILGNNEVPVYESRYGEFYGQRDKKEYTVPTLEEYIEAFKDTGLVHDTEIKSRNPAIIPVYKEMVDAWDAWDQFFTITFNVPILEAVYNEYPELSIGALGYGSMTEVNYGGYESLTESRGAEAALEKLYGQLDQWNATYNPGIGGGFSEKMVRAARHRGLTVWPWTYQTDLSAHPDSQTQRFARDYILGVSGLTVDFTWITSGFIVEILSDDVTADSVEDIPGPQARTQEGIVIDLPDAEPVELETLGNKKDHLMIWRYKASMVINGDNYGSYYLYSNPFVFTEAGGE